MRFLYLFLFVFIVACGPSQNATTQENNGEQEAKASQEPKELEEMDFKVLDSKYITRDDVFAVLKADVLRFRESSPSGNRKKDEMNEYVLEKTIPEIQSAIYENKFTYRDLALFYLDRIYRYDRNNELSLNSVISLNPKVLEQATAADKRMDQMKSYGESFNPYTITGMPILLKDNINTADMPTTAGAATLMENQTRDAQIVTNLKDAGAIILGKANLSEWAYFFCGDCPSGYSAVGGQTLSPYKRKFIDTGGSSSGSGVSVAANLAVAAVGSETSGSILSPSSQNSVVGFKPKVGTLSGDGIVPISSYLDTAGPMAKSVIDAAILMQALTGDTSNAFIDNTLLKKLDEASLKGRRFGIFPDFKSNPLYAKAIQDVKNLGGVIVELPAREVQLNNFLTVLNADMRQDLPAYFKESANKKYNGWDVGKVMMENRKDSINAMPYGQRLFQGIMDEKEMTDAEFLAVKNNITANAQNYFDSYINDYGLDGFLSINNYSAGIAAVGFYPALTVPMGYDLNGVPYGLTFITKDDLSRQLFVWAAAYENAYPKRKIPSNYTK
ncbi:amidase family protein [Nonlabens ponticola]|uniref:Amidase n=1 Tax=Nonlabens ponticola TaxID=2496866 RepID=A0A3S9MXI6_9FLAO|nr:amidase family protein [Nonlabens ponticola]AZQ43852.1 amidase [Nonlabens ponticola]